MSDSGGECGGRGRGDGADGRGGATVVGVDFQAVDGPVGRFERLRVVLHVVGATRRFTRTCAIRAPDGTRPITAESGVEDDIVVVEVVVDGAAVATLEGSCCGAPRRGVRVGACSVRRDAAAGEEPDVDGGAGPFHGVDAAVGVVEAVTEGGRTACLGAAAGVSLAVGVDHGAAAAGVHGHCVLVLVVDTFDDVDFAVVGPVGTLMAMSVLGRIMRRLGLSHTSHPEGGPDPTC